MYKPQYCPGKMAKFPEESVTPQKLWGTLECGSTTPCPGCGHDLGYYAELGSEVTCENCGKKFALTRRTEIDYEEVGL